MQKQEPSIYDHEERIVILEGSVSEIREDLRERYARIDESTKYLRELSQEQIKQNNHILNSVLAGNQDAQKRASDLEKIKTENKSKFLLSAIGSGGIISIILQLLK